MNRPNAFLMSTTFFLCGLFAQSLFSQTVDSGSMRMMPGIAAATQSADLAPVINQRLAEILVHEGEFVQKGQLLARLESGVAEAEYAAAKALADDRSELGIAKLEMEEAAHRLRRIEEAMTTGASNRIELRIAKGEFEKSFAAVKIAESRQVRAEKIAETAQMQLETFMIRAPFDGVITRKHISAGNTVDAGRPVLSIVDAAKLRIELNLPLELFGKLEAGRQYELTGSTPVNRTFNASLEFVSPGIDAASQSFRCVFYVENAIEKMPAGFPVRLSASEIGRITGQTLANHTPVSE